MKQYQATLDTAQIQICCKKGRFTFYNGEVISDGEIARQFPKYFVELTPEGAEFPEPTVPENFLGTALKIEEPAVAEAPVEEAPVPEVEETPVVEETEEVEPETAEEAAQEAAPAGEPVKVKGKPGRKPKGA